MATLQYHLDQHRKSGSIAREIRLQRFINETVFETSCGDLGLVLSVQGVDPDCLTDERLNALTRRYESALRAFDDRFRLYHYIVKRSGAKAERRTVYPEGPVAAAMHRRLSDLDARSASLFETKLYAVVLYEGFRPESHWFQSASDAESIAQQATQSVELLLGATRSFVSLLDDFLPMAVLSQRDAVTFFRQIMNPEKTHAEAFHFSPDMNLDSGICDSQIEVHSHFLKVNDYYLKSIALKELPASSDPGMLRDLLAIPCDFIICTEWKPQSNLAMRRVLKRKRTAWDSMKISLVAVAVHGRAVPKSELPRKHEIEEQEDSVGASLVEIESHGNYFGAYSCTILLLGTELVKVQQAYSEVVKVFGKWDASLMQERLNLLRSYLACIPGNYDRNSRYRYLLNVDFANMALIWQSYTGAKTNPHLNDEYLCLYETSDQQLFYFNGHVGGVFGINVLGAPESGKSFDSNYRIAMLQKYDPITLILDIGGSYRDTTAEFGGSYFEIGMEHRPAMNPFWLAPTQDNIQFLFHFVRLLVGYDKNAKPEDQALEDKRIYEAIETMYVLNPEDRRLGNLTLPGLLNQRLGRWKTGGQYGSFFDHAENDIELGRFSAFEFQGMEKYTDVLTPLCFLITQLFSAKVYDRSLADRFKIQLLDEVWRFMMMSDMGLYMVSSVKTGRKHNLGNLFVTQSGLDAERAGIGEMLREACPMTVFLANPNIKKSTYMELYGLNEKQAERITTLKPKREQAILTPSYFKVVELRIDNDYDRQLYANDPNTNRVKEQKRRAAIA